MTPEERYAHRRFFTADDDEVRAWQQLGLAYESILDMLKDEFWQAQDVAEDDPLEEVMVNVAREWSGESDRAEFID